MYSLGLLALSLLYSSAVAYEANLTVWSTDSCGGDSDLLYIDVSPFWCFDTPGKSFSRYSESNSEWDDDVYCYIVTYSEKGCPADSGTCAYFGPEDVPCQQNFGVPIDGACESLPFSSVLIDCSGTRLWSLVPKHNVLLYSGKMCYPPTPHSFFFHVLLFWACRRRANCVWSCLCRNERKSPA